MARYFVVIPAAGSGTRMGAGCPKQYLELLGVPMLRHSLDLFAQHERIAGICVAVAPDDDWWDRYDWSALTPHSSGRLRLLRVGGASRAETVANALEAMRAELADDDWVLVHDAARPCLSAQLLDKLIDTVGADPVGGILAVPVADTLKREDGAGRIAATVPRETLWAAQTPQMFPYGLLRRALREAGTAVTDEASAVEALGLSPRLVAADRSNLKVTYAGDLAMAAWILSANRS